MSYPQPPWPEDQQPPQAPAQSYPQPSYPQQPYPQPPYAQQYGHPAGQAYQPTVQHVQTTASSGLPVWMHLLYAIGGVLTCGILWVVWIVHWWFAQRKTTSTTVAHQFPGQQQPYGPHQGGHPRG